MNKIWVFGDSFSTPFKKSTDPWSVRYCEWKGYQPNYFGEVLGEMLGMENESFGMGGSSNSHILEKISENAIGFREGDIVIIGWSDAARFRMEIGDRWMNFVPEMVTLRHWDYESPFLSQRTLEEIMVNRTHILYWKEVINWSNLLRTLLEGRGIKVIFWTPFYLWKDYEHKEQAVLDLLPNDWFIGYNVHNITADSKWVIDDEIGRASCRERV